MKIGLDCDGVILNCGLLRARGAQILYGISISPDIFCKRYVVEEMGLLTAEQYKSLQHFIYGSRDALPLMEMVDGALFFISKLIKEGNELLVVTSRYEKELDIVHEFLGGQGLDLNLVGVGDNGKAGAVKGFQVFIDDDLSKLKSLAGIVPFLFLFSWWYNKDAIEAGLAERVSSWSTFYERIKYLKSAGSLVV